MKANAETVKKRVAAVFFCLLAVYLLYHGIHALRKPADLVPATPETVYEKLTLDGAFYEEKTLVSAEQKGVAVLRFEAGEKVAKGAPLGDIYPEKEHKTVDRLNTLHHLIYKLEKDAHLVPRSDKTLLETYENALRPLREEQETLLSALGEPLETVYAPLSGYPYPANGRETELSPSLLDTLTAEALEKSLAAAPAVQETPTFALLTDHRRTYAAKVTKAEAAELTVGTSYPVASDRPLNLTLTEKRDGTGVLLIFTLDGGLQKYEGGAEALTLIRAEHRGLRIPEKALCHKEGRTYVFVFTDGVARRREVNVLAKEGNFFLVSEAYESPDGESLCRNDLVFASPKGLRDGKPID